MMLNQVTGNFSIRTGLQPVRMEELVLTGDKITVKKVALPVLRTAFLPKTLDAMLTAYESCDLQLKRYA